MTFETYVKIAIAIVIIGCFVVLWEYYYDLKIKPPKIVKVEVEKVVEVDRSWHLPEIKGYVAEIKYKR